MKIWDCTIGEVEDVPDGADAPMRRAVREAYVKLTGKEPVFLFSGWGGQLTDVQREVVNEQAGGYDHED